MGKFKEGNQAGRRNFSAIREGLYKKQKNLFSAIDNRIRRRKLFMKEFSNWWIKPGIGYVGKDMKRKLSLKQRRLLKIMILNMDRDRWVRAVRTIHNYYADNPGRHQAKSKYLYFNYDWRGAVRSLRELGIIEDVATIPPLEPRKKKKRMAYRISEEAIKLLDLPEKYLYTGSTYQYDKGILELHAEYNRYLLEQELAKEGLKS